MELRKEIAKMSIANKYNKGSGFNFKVPETFEYVSPEELYKANGENHVYLVKALYINRKSQYGDAPVIVTDECMVNAPSHLLDTVNDMLQDEELIEAVNNDLFGFKIYQYNTNKAKGTYYSVKWVDIER